ncbi:MAG: hypothetical protein KFH98_10165 [Gemmatimonadetes bacterium]|nr:hypothetical protein [Gemmatimonadota bacterium]
MEATPPIFDPVDAAFRIRVDRLEGSFVTLLRGVHAWRISGTESGE